MLLGDASPFKWRAVLRHVVGSRSMHGLRSSSSWLRPSTVYTPSFPRLCLSTSSASLAASSSVEPSRVHMRAALRECNRAVSRRLLTFSPITISVRSWLWRRRIRLRRKRAVHHDWSPPRSCSPPACQLDVGRRRRAGRSGPPSRRRRWASNRSGALLSSDGTPSPPRVGCSNPKHAVLWMYPIASLRRARPAGATEPISLSWPPVEGPAVTTTRCQRRWNSKSASEPRVLLTIDLSVTT